MNAGPGSDPVGKLPVLHTVFEAYRFVFGQPVSLVMAMAVPLFLWYLLQFEVTPLVLDGLDAALSPTDAHSRAPAGKLLVFTYVSTQWAFWLFVETLFAVAWHRFVLLGPATARPRAFVLWRSRHWRFFGYLLIILVFYVPTSPLLLVTLPSELIFPLSGARLAWIGVGVLLMCVVMAYLVVRLSLVFPASAIDRKCSFRESWRRTHGQGLRLVIATSLGALPLLSIEILKGFLIESEMVTRGDYHTFVDQPILGSYKIDLFVTMLVVFLTTALTVTVLSLAFRHCTGRQSPSVADGRSI